MTQDHSPDHDVKRAIKTEYITSKKNTTPDHKNHNNGDNNLKNHDHVKQLSKHPRCPDKEDHHRCKEKRQWKKAAMDQGPDTPPGMPRWLRDVVEEKGGHGERFLSKKGLTTSDVLVGGQNRISMPVRQLRSPDDFLTEEELRNVLRRKDDDEKHFKGLNVTFVEPYSRTSMLSLRKWDYDSSSSYVFASKELKDFIERNGLKAGDIIQIWFFRCNDGSPCFALVNLTIETASSSTNSSSMLSLQIKKIT
ncbi:hypothetical protein TIFTF001_014216 [Ficus carica]|uniref:TF-B3 domain-containing protein n=1 Tax=Ficus carica TaxID=3494 RepID=A0AA88AJ76_FICCA|nr:hypothetical protein TIFTF001_014216 [Ficus carica]